MPEVRQTASQAPRSDWRLALQDSWSRRGPLGGLLLPIAWLYGALVWARERLYRAHCLRSHALGVPVVVVGNWVAGGAGKTPTVIALVKSLQARGYKPAVVSRGHGRAGQGISAVEWNSAVQAVGDEPLLIRRRTAVPVWVGRERVRAAEAMLRAHPEVDLIVSDDGLQHLALVRQAQIVVFDERGLGNGWLLPAGPLREHPPKRLSHNTIVLYNAAAPSTPLPGFLARRSLAGILLLSAWRAGGTPGVNSVDPLRGVRAYAVAGIARPGRFFDTLQQAGLKFDPLPLPDHHPFDRPPWPAGCSDVIVTEKDAVKIPDSFAAPTPAQPRIWVAVLGYELPDALMDALTRLLPPTRTPPPETTPHGQPPA
jgi:tetraacyldisaccharide 4'-kinase